MVDSKVRTCKLCFTIIEDENYEAIDSKSKNILIIDLLKLDFDDDRNHEVCNVCSAALFAAQNFKKTCLCTENSINRYVDTTVLPFDLREIYMRQSTREHISEDVQICRLCMQLINDISEFESINEEHVDMIQKLVPEMNIFTIQEPIICKNCQDSLGVHCNFLKKCWNAEQNISNGSNGYISNVPTPEPAVNISVKIEHVDTEFEDVPELKKECMDINYEEIKIESDIHGHEITSEEPAACKDPEPQCYTSLNEHKERMAIQEYPSTLKNPSKVRMFKCTNCNYETKHMQFVKRHMLIHKRPSKVYKCEACDYETKIKGSFKRHLLIHKDPSEVQMYKCAHCNCETKYKTYLKEHMLIHKDPSEVKTYKCEYCDYETKIRAYLRNHMLTHRDSSEVQIYKCENCAFETRQKGNLKSHMLKHRDPSEVKVYKCEHCNYETIHKGYLKQHVLVHKDPSKAQMYKCETCNYETNMKGCLKRHMLIHKDSSEVQMYRCENCDFQTVHKRYLKQHILVHKDPSEVQMYKCGDCNFETMYKRNLNHHMLVHKDPAEVQVYKCESCEFKTVRRGSLKLHILKHKFGLELEMYKCENCPFETEQRGILNNHMLIHGDRSEVKL